VFEREIKVSQCLGDTNLSCVCADVSSVETGLQIVPDFDFDEISRLKLNIEKTKTMWLGKWANNKNNPLHLKWASSLNRNEFPSFEDIASMCYASLNSLLRIAFSSYHYELLFVCFISI